MNQNAKRPRTVKIPNLVIWEDGDLTQVNPNQLIYPVLAESENFVKFKDNNRCLTLYTGDWCGLKRGQK